MRTVRTVKVDVHGTRQRYVVFGKPSLRSLQLAHLLLGDVILRELFQFWEGEDENVSSLEVYVKHNSSVCVNNVTFLFLTIFVICDYNKTVTR